jgi:hypothetical protein
MIYAVVPSWWESSSLRFRGWWWRCFDGWEIDFGGYSDVCLFDIKSAIFHP